MQVCLVTASTAGIGLGIARRLGLEGASVMVSLASAGICQPAIKQAAYNAHVPSVCATCDNWTDRLTKLTDHHDFYAACVPHAAKQICSRKAENVEKTVKQLQASMRACVVCLCPVLASLY
jgi:NAD(P)-dependent dehydrogenase (short-subunit alcohol dehydrogenase family)